MLGSSKGNLKIEMDIRLFYLRNPAFNLRGKFAALRVAMISLLSRKEAKKPYWADYDMISIVVKNSS
jgi:hypothetical protein